MFNILSTACLRKAKIFKNSLFYMIILSSPNNPGKIADEGEFFLIYKILT